MNYEQKMQKHLANDTIVTDKEVRKIEHKFNVETKAWLEILSAGKDFGQERWTKNNLVSTKNLCLYFMVLPRTTKQLKMPK